MPAGRWRPAATGCGGQGMTWAGAGMAARSPFRGLNSHRAATTARFRLRKLFTKASLVSSAFHRRLICANQA
jgi:hypothetical protein